MVRFASGAVIVGLSAALIVGAAADETGQATGVRQSFSAEAAVVTVDVLVLDDDGQPVRGLEKGDFVVFDDGRPQAIVGFKARELPPEPPTPEGHEATPLPAVVPEASTNEGADASPGRVLALLVDDLGVSAQTMSRLQPALAGWIRRADPRDELTVMNTSGDVWWSDTVGRGRPDLLTALERLKGRKMAGPQSAGDMSEWEAYQIDQLGTGREPEFRLNPESRRPQFQGASTLDRLLQRAFDQRACECQPYGDCTAEVRGCVQRVRTMANEVRSRWSRRAQAILATLGNLSRSLSSVAGRKSILLVSEEFLQDEALATPVRAALSRLQEANVAVYFLGARGLIGNPTFSVEQDYAPRAQDIMGMGMEQTTLATEGAVALADATGGVAITSSNDLAAGLERMALDSSAYYLVGYQSERPPDGKWHKLEVKVSRPGLKVRARRRYFAERPEDRAQAVPQKPRAQAGRLKDIDEKVGKRELPPSILTGSARGGLPLRLRAHVQETDHAGQVRVQIVVEIDNRRVQVDKATTPWGATLDLTILVAGLHRSPTVPVDERLRLTLAAGDVENGWWLVPRKVWLPPGVTQVRVFARDTLSGAEGVVTERLVVPDVDQPYLSTPILTDRTLPPLKSGEPPRLVPTAQRRFGKARPLLCQYEVFSFGGRTLEGVPQLVASYTLLHGEGQVVSSDTPTPIETDGFRAVRRITLPTEQLAEGPYVLEVRVDDRLAQRSLTAKTPFVIEAGSGADASGPGATPQ